MNIQARTLFLASSLALAIAAASTSALAESSSQDIIEARQESQIETTYTLNRYLRDFDLKATVDNGVAILSGRVPDESNKELANEIAMNVSGIKSVTNDIAVDKDFTPTRTSKERTFSEVIDDAGITAAIKSKLLWSRYAQGMDTKVATRAGKVTLSGTVNSSEAREHAVDLAMNTEGVNSVDNQLRIQNKESGMVASGKNALDDAGEDIADTWITTKVKSTLLYSRNVSGTDINVTTATGIVTLSGKVHDGKERAAAVKLTQSVRGVKNVQANALTF